MMDMWLDQLTCFKFASIVALSAPHQLAVTQHRASMLGEAEQYTKLGWCERERSAIERRNLMPSIELQYSDRDQPLSRCFRLSRLGRSLALLQFLHRRANNFQQRTLAQSLCP